MTRLIVYEAMVGDGYEWVMPEQEEDLDVIMQLHGASVGPHWVPIRMRLIREDEDDESGRMDLGQESDFPWFGSGVVVVRQRARDGLQDLLERYGELLPLICDDAELWLFNVTTVVDGLDEARSEVVRFSTGGMHIRQPAFHANRISGLAVFKVPQALHGIFFGDEFVERVHSLDLRGLDFEQVWAGEEGD